MIEIPRYVHRDGDAMLVDTLEELRIAESEGWRVNPNEPDVLWTEQPEPVRSPDPEADEKWTTAWADPLAASGEAQDAPDEASEGDARTGDVTDEVQDLAETPEPTAPVKRGPGRPRRNG